jgi:hypothetical protein
MVLYGHFEQLPQYQSSSWPQAWQDIVGLEWAEAVGPLLELEERTERIVKAQSNVDQARLLHHRQEWRQAILLNGVELNKQMSSTAFQLSDSALSGLYAVALYIAGLPGITSEAADADLERLAAAVGSLREDVIRSVDLDSDLRTFLLERVNEMQRRIDLSRISGSGPIEDLRQDTIGSAATQASMWDRALHSPVSIKVIALFAALNIYNGGVAAINNSIGSTEKLIRTVTTVAERILGDPPKQIEAPLQLAVLPGGPSTSNNDDARVASADNDS